MKYSTKIKFKLIKSHILCIVLILVSHLFGQNISAKEQTLLELEKKYAQENSKLSSLQSDMDKTINLLEQIKKETPRNDAKIERLMASAFNMSTDVDKQRKIVETQANLVKDQRRTLYNVYSQKIDSLTHFLDKIPDGLASADIEEQIEKLNNKRIHVSPMLPLFSFDPRLISKISLHNLGDSLENSLFSDYLNRALEEVDSNIFVIHIKSEEARQAMYLRNRTEDFLEDIDDSQIFSTLDNQARSYTNREYFDNSASLFNDQLKDIGVIYTQLQPVLNDYLELPHFAHADSIAIEDYIKILDDTEKTLKLYREMIKKKID